MSDYFILLNIIMIVYDILVLKQNCGTKQTWASSDKNKLSWLELTQNDKKRSTAHKLNYLFYLIFLFFFSKQKINLI